MSIAKIQTGDKVKVIAGSYKGQQGVVTKVINKKGGSKRVTVSNIAKIAKYQRANKAFGMPGLKLEKDRTFDVSNISLVNEEGKVSKVKISSEGEKKVRIYKKGDVQVKKESVTVKEDKKEESKKSDKNK